MFRPHQLTNRIATTKEPPETASFGSKSLGESHVSNHHDRRGRIDRACDRVSAQAQFGSALEARAMLERMAAAVKVDKAKALDQMQKGEAGFKDRDLYAFCANVSDGVLTAHPALKELLFKASRTRTERLSERR